MILWNNFVVLFAYMNTIKTFKFFCLGCIVAIIYACSSPVKDFSNNCNSILDSTDLIEFIKGDSIHRFVHPWDVMNLKKFLAPVDLAETQLKVAECPIQIYLYRNSEIIGKIGFLKINDGLLYSMANQTMQSAPNDSLNRFISKIPFFK